MIFFLCKIDKNFTSTNVDALRILICPSVRLETVYLVEIENFLLKVL